MIWSVGGIHMYSAFWHDTDGSAVNLAFLDGHAAFTRIEWGEGWTSRYAFPYKWCEEPDP